MTSLDHGPAGPARLFAVAVQLLTRLRVDANLSPADLPRATAAFPAVGVLVAALAAGVRAGGEPLLGAGAATVAAVLAVVVVTGGLHEDGLADAADGLWGGHDPGRRLAIMRDSQLGVYGVVALVGALGLQVAILAPLPVEAFAAAVGAGHVLGRATAPALARWVPAADRSGLGASVAGGPDAAGWVAVGVTAVGVAAVASAATATVWWTPVPLGVAALVAVGVGAMLRRRLGGITGDGYGATIVVTQVAVMATVAGLHRLVAV